MVTDATSSSPRVTVLATSAKKVLAENLRQRAHKEEQAIADAKTTEKLAGIELKMAAKLGQGNKLFGSINNANVADELAAVVLPLIRNSSL